MASRSRRLSGSRPTAASSSPRRAACSRSSTASPTRRRPRSSTSAREVDDYWDRGLLGLALDPNFPTTPYVYLLYTYDAPPGPDRAGLERRLPDAARARTTDGCVVTGKLVRLQLSGNTVASSHDADQRRVVPAVPEPLDRRPQLRLRRRPLRQGGDGASFNFADYGQGGGSAGSPTPANPCGDPPAGVGGTETPPTAEGGALRCQSVATCTPASPCC